jgi:hypothetical protein
LQAHPEVPLQEFMGGQVEADFNVRLIRLDNDNIIKFERKDPYGHWFISYNRGQLPEELTGAYTSFDIAKRDVDRYLLEKKRTAVEVPRKK